MIKQWLEHWRRLAPREQKMVATAAAVIGFALLAQGIYSLQERRERLRQQWPQLERQAALIQQQATEWQTLKSAPAAPLAQGAALEKTLRDELTAMTGGEFTLVLIAPRQLSLKGELPFNAWIDWTAQVHARHHLRVNRADVRPGSRPGHVTVMVELGDDGAS